MDYSIRGDDMTETNGRIYPDDGMHLKNTHTGEIYNGYIVPAKSLSEADFTEVTEAEYQAYLTAEEEISDSESLAIITGSADI